MQGLRCYQAKINMKHLITIVGPIMGKTAILIKSGWDYFTGDRYFQGNIQLQF
jgi:hypothetical protein